MNPSNDSREMLEHIHEEHQELRDLLGRTQKLLSGRQEPPLEAVSLMETACRHVAEHFQDEEKEGGFFDQIVDDAPRYLKRVESLRLEHAQLSNLAEKLLAHAQLMSGSEDWWSELEANFHEFCKTLMHHESSEGDLLQETYVEDLGAQD